MKVYTNFVQLWKVTGRYTISYISSFTYCDENRHSFNPSEITYTWLSVAVVVECPWCKSILITYWHLSTCHWLQLSRCTRQLRHWHVCRIVTSSLLYVAENCIHRRFNRMTKSHWNDDVKRAQKLKRAARKRVYTWRKIWR